MTRPARSAVLHLALLTALLLCAIAPARAAADELDEGGALYAVQNRKHVVSHEFTLGVGTVPLDAYYKSLTGTFAYTFHFTDLIAWEIVQATYALNLDTDLREELETNWGVQPTEFPELAYFFDSNFVIKPLYGKFAFLNDGLVYGETFFVIGPAFANYENAGWYVGPNAGMGFRFYLGDSFAVRLDIRDYFFASPSDLSDTSNELFLQASLGLNIR